jgi:hypothetical protein
MGTGYVVSGTLSQPVSHHVATKITHLTFKNLHQPSSYIKPVMQKRVWMLPERVDK